MECINPLHTMMFTSASSPLFGKWFSELDKFTNVYTSLSILLMQSADNRLREKIEIEIEIEMNDCICKNQSSSKSNLQGAMYLWIKYRRILPTFPLPLHIVHTSHSLIFLSPPNVIFFLSHTSFFLPLWLTFEY